ncbi:MAG: hypothetical protein ACREA2_20905 [Blastocatellia bacterium]
MAKRKKRQQQVSEPPVFGNGMPVLSVEDRNTSHIQIYLRDAGAYMVGTADSDPNSVIVGEVYRLGGRPVDESEELDPDGYYILVDKDQLVDPPPRPDREPRPEYSLEIDRRALHFWLRDHFGALFDWSVANDMSAAGVARFKDLSRSLFVKKMTRRAEAHIAKRLPKLFHLAITQLSVELEAFKPAMFFEGIGDMEKEYLPKKSDLKSTQALFYDVFSGGMETRAHGGSKAKADLSKLKKHFDAHIGAVKEAFADCRQALLSRSQSKRQSWREDIKRNFPQFAGHEDLITLLQPATDWPEDLARVCIKKEIDSDPEHICLALATRLCGAVGFSHKISTLREYIKRQNRNFKNKT